MHHVCFIVGSCAVSSVALKYLIDCPEGGVYGTFILTPRRCRVSQDATTELYGCEDWLEKDKGHLVAPT